MTDAPPLALSWSRVESWLAAHAPATHRELAPPAERADIAEAERALGVPFPPSLVESLSRHDGSGYHELVFMYRLLSVAEIVDRATMCRRIRREAGLPREHPPDQDVYDGWDDLWIPFATDDCGNHLVLDQRSVRAPARVGLDDHEQGGRFGVHPVYRSLPTLLDAVAHALETGEVVHHWEPIVTSEGELEWEVE
ncbi:SMI1/KNR4 family protein [Streptomyces sp. AJS327]|uniref:SMI1/KNR4 family protein n=1 Tax=Streptomyces sp. AJS327 TaxID=2545265 RepID=UPI0015DD7B3A|nr:SMI1/KNR4 family protein [Streptomyces sp. AJS327]MBA0053403.1 SMI1/KNR4 family protein [Streptomyces sp. AJS327]